jgi:hypothetical protein
MCIESTGLSFDQVEIFSGVVRGLAISTPNILAKIKLPTMTKIVNLITDNDAFRNVDKEVLMAMVEAVVSAASCQLDLVMALSKEKSAGELGMVQNKKCFEEDIEKFRQKNGEVHPELMPTRQFYETVRKDPVRYYDLNKNVTTELSKTSSTLSKLANELSEKHEDDHIMDLKGVRVPQAAQWIKAISRLLICMAMVTDLNLLSISYYIFKISDLAARHSWNFALQCDMEIRKRFEKLANSGRDINQLFINDTLTESCVSKVLSTLAIDSQKVRPNPAPSPHQLGRVSSSCC